MLRTVRTLIVDEIHAVAGNRRGSHLALSMERLDALVEGPLQRIGLSATQKPIEEVARFLVGGGGRKQRKRLDGKEQSLLTSAPTVEIVDCGYRREIDLALELPGSPLEAVMSHEVWAEVYERLASLIETHQTTLVFVNTRRMAERVTRQLEERLGKEKVTSHHGSLSAKLRLEAEDRLKKGQLKALVATASLELGIDIGSVDLVCQLGSTRSISTLLQRAGRAEHKRGGLPKARMFPLSRDELVESVSLLRCVRNGELDRLRIPKKPLDVLAQQIVACAASEDCDETELFDLLRGAWPYRNLTREEFEQVLRMLAEGFSTKRGRRGALLHHDGVNHRVRGRRGARLVALTSGGAIPDTGDYRVVVEPTETFIGTVNEDFAIESLAGDIFQLGNASWRILGVNSGTVRVEDAHGQPPSIPFWLGEAPGRTSELSVAVSELRGEMEKQVAASTSTESPLTLPGVPEAARRQLVDYFSAAYKILGVIPSQKKLVIERFFDESGGMQLVIHSPFGIRVNRAWGLALRKRFCRSFNFELQAAATDDAIVLSLGTQHSFPLEEVFRYLNSKTVRDLLIQALLDAPMFGIHWRWDATRALALPRQRGGRKIPAPLQKMESENLLAAVFPDQLACLENIVGDREVPDHPLVKQTIEDCLTEAMDIDGLIHVLQMIEKGEVECIARDLPEPSPLAHEILNARPYAFLDDAPLEERRTQAVYTRRASDAANGNELGILDAAAIEKVRLEAWPRATNADELHEALLVVGVMSDEEIRRTANGEAESLLENLVSSRRIGRGHKSNAADHNNGAVPLTPGRSLGERESHLPLSRSTGAAEATSAAHNILPLPKGEGRGEGEQRVVSSATRVSSDAFWVAAERVPIIYAVYPDALIEPLLTAPAAELKNSWERADALRELVRGRMEVSGPLTASALAEFFQVPRAEIDIALLGLEGEGFILRGKFHSGAQELEWCDRRLLARIHRLTINRLRAEIQPVSIAEFQRFLLAWQRVDGEHRAEGPEGVSTVLEMLDGYELPAGAWEPEVLALRIKEYDPHWLDQLCFTGRTGWGRLTPPANQNGRPFAPVRSSPVSVYVRDHLHHWLELSSAVGPADFAPDTALVLERLSRGGALFFGEIVKQTGLLPSRVEQALAELVAQGWATSDTFEGLRALLLPQEKRAPFANGEHKRRHKTITSVEFAGRWSLLQRTPADEQNSVSRDQAGHDAALETFARILLRRYGIVFRRMLDRESLNVTWYELGRVYRRLEARGEIRGGHFVGGVSGEQFALPEAIGMLRSLRKKPGAGELLAISGADPLNLCGILTPGQRIAAIAANRIVLRDGVPVAGLEGGKIVTLESEAKDLDLAAERTLRIGTLPVALRRYYA